MWPFTCDWKGLSKGLADRALNGDEHAHALGQCTLMASKCAIKSPCVVCLAEQLHKVPQMASARMSS